MAQEQATKAIIRSEVTPYAIHVYLKEVHGVERSGNQIYQDRKHGKLTATRKVDKVDGREKWFVTADEANRYVREEVLGRSTTKRQKAWW